jgi:hypothetical protein
MSYTNADGLFVLTDNDQGDAVNRGIMVDAATKWLVYTIEDATLLPDTAGAADVNPNDPFIPANAYITRSFTVVETAFTSGGSATLDVGLVNAAGTEIDLDGIDADASLGSLNAVGDAVVNNGALVAGSTGVGSANAYVVASYETAAFTAGKAHVYIEYIELPS